MKRDQIDRALDAFERLADALERGVGIAEEIIGKKPAKKKGEKKDAGEPTPTTAPADAK